MMKRIYLIAAICFIGTLLLPMSANAQQIYNSSKDKPMWASSTYRRTLPFSYLEVVTLTGNDETTMVNSAREEIKKRVKLRVGENDPWIKSILIASYFELTDQGQKGYFLFQTLKNPSYKPEAVHSTTDYGFSPRVFIPGAQQIWKGQGGKAALFIGGEAACIGGIILSKSLKDTYISKRDNTHNNSQRQNYTDMANTWNIAGYGFIAGAIVFYAWNIIDGIVSPGRPTIKYNNNILTFAPYASPYSTGLAMNFNF